MKVYIDIGTNLMQGFYQISRIENIGSDWKKIFIEPNPECWGDIEERLKELDNYTFYKNAVSTEKAKVMLVTRADNKKDMAATILGESFLKDSLSIHGIEVTDFNQYEIDTITIDELFRDIEPDDDVIIKLDAEGVEYDILDYILSKSFPIKKIYCEFHVHSQHDNLRKIDLMDRLSKTIDIVEWQ